MHLAVICITFATFKIPDWLIDWYSFVESYTLRNGVALLKPHLNVAIFSLLKCVHIIYRDVAFTVKPH